MAFEQTRDVLDHARKFHRTLSAFYEELRDSAGKERTRALLDYMSRHEKYLGESLAEFEEEVSEGILDTYFKYGSEASPIREITDFEIKPDMDVEHVLEAAMHFDACLIKYYREMAGYSVSQKVKEVFENLLVMEQHEQVELSKQALGLTTI